MKIYIDINEIKDYRDRIIDVSPKVYAEFEVDENYDIERVRKLKQEMQEWLNVRISGCLK